jgi:tetratricopeptide (TPR) repeat protein
VAERALGIMNFGMGHHVLAQALYAQGFQFWEQQKYRQAGTYFQRATEHDPNHADAFLGLGLAYRKVAILTENPALLTDAEQALGKAIEIDRNHKKAKAALDRLDDIKRALEIRPKDGDGYVRRGLALMNADAYEDARTDLVQAIKLGPDRFDAYKALDDLLASRREWDTIIGYWTKFLKRHPGHAQAYFERGGAHYNKGDLVNALKDAKTACRLGLQDACRKYDQLKPPIKAIS